MSPIVNLKITHLLQTHLDKDQTHLATLNANILELRCMAEPQLLNDPKSHSNRV